MIMSNVCTERKGTKQPSLQGPLIITLHAKKYPCSHENDGIPKSISSLSSIDGQHPKQEAEEDWSTFHPEFTHQLFENDIILGYKPYPQEPLLNNNELSLVTNDEVNGGSEQPLDDDKYLKIDIILSSSCHSCHVYVKSYDPTTWKESSISNDLNQIISKLKMAIPPVISINGEICAGQQSTFDKPFGKIIHHYSPTKRSSESMVMTLADPSAELSVLEYHNAVQNLSMFFIESASTVDISNTAGGFWKIMYLFCSHSSATKGFESDDDNIGTGENNNSKRRKIENNIFSLVGYTTLYYFHAPFKRPKPGLVVRICQMLILPPYQRCGHGKVMMEQIYNLIQKDDDKEIVVELNVEDPCVGFTLLRNRIDYEFLKKKCEELLPERYRCTLVNILADNECDEENLKKLFPVLPDTEGIKIASLMKVTKNQVHAAYELYKLDFGQRHFKIISVNKNSTGNDIAKQDKNSAAAQKQFRIMVKKRLMKTYAERIGSVNELS
eukprot:CAMPEP_0194363414 /NCGR_PEP_ID=MMETSP0174-20130528/11211_1 /TAXON_ID=216777 /ORGANISM="Proboscia alata, Strain PI-D3" /LENGTH=496 /DNA_ID=CAMNT_0039136797 /DNA_START=84 /DNA_END=1570 /DNA_ORIENTATION=-